MLLRSVVFIGMSAAALALEPAVGHAQLPARTQKFKVGDIVLREGTVYKRAQFGESGANAARRANATPGSGRVPATARSAAAGAVESTRVVGATIDQYCVSCHSERQKTAGLVLEHADLEHLSARADVWEKVVRKLRARTMPPVGMPRPDVHRYDEVVASLEGALDQAAANAPNPGRPVAHRLNRAEYVNAVRDILAVEIDGPSLLPSDTSGYGFDNVADVLTTSPGLLERYVSVARKVSRIAVGDPTLPPALQTYRVSHLAWQDDRMSELLPFGTRGGVAARHFFPVDGEYLLRIDFNLGYNQSRSDVRGRDEDNDVEIRLDGKRVKLLAFPKATGHGVYAVAEPMDPPEFRFRVTAGPHVLGVAFVKHPGEPEGFGPARMPIGSTSYAQPNTGSGEYGRIDMGLEYLQVEGPFNGSTPVHSPSRDRLFVCQPRRTQDEEPCARKILHTLARRAYRRPPSEQEIATLVGFYQAGRREKDFDRGIQLALQRILVAPAFLFRMERAPSDRGVSGGAYRVSDFDLASRLSFFLWSSVPDDALLDCAARGALSDAAVLKQQVRRMLGDPRARALVENFFGQWLYLRNVATVTPDATLFPEFDDNLRSAFQRETELFLGSQLRDDRSATELLTANYTFLNERLARHYGIPNVYGSHFRRVQYPDNRRAGLLGQASILTVTSYANRTSPVIRGKWLLENILGTPPPEPPPNVPPLKEDDNTQAPTSVRQRMERHRRNALCASCHTQLDAMGFGLDNFDAIGQWRDAEGSTAVDASGAFPDGAKFADIATFRNALLAHRQEFVTTLVERLLTYALGRGIEAYDMPAVRTIVRRTASDDYRWSSLIGSIVDSVPFQMRRSS